MDICSVFLCLLFLTAGGGGNRSTRRKPPRHGENMQTPHTQVGSGNRTPNSGGVFGDEVKSVSVMEGQNVTLHTDLTHIQTDDLIMWSYGPENTFVARLNGKANSTMFSDDERFRDRVKLNDQTGDLIITHITSQHSGLYTLKISRNKKVSYKTFNLTVYKNIINSINKRSQQAQHLITDDSPKSSDSRPMRVTLISVVFALVICVIIIIFI